MINSPAKTSDLQSYGESPEINPVSQMKWAHEVPGMCVLAKKGSEVITMIIYIIMHVGDFHFLWECRRVILDAFWGDVRAVGSLSNLRQHVN